MHARFRSQCTKIQNGLLSWAVFRMSTTRSCTMSGAMISASAWVWSLFIFSELWLDKTPMAPLMVPLIDKIILLIAVTHRVSFRKSHVLPMHQFMRNLSFLQNEIRLWKAGIGTVQIGRTLGIWNDSLVFLITTRQSHMTTAQQIVSSRK